MTRVGFWDLFEPMPDGAIKPKKKIKIAGVVLDPDNTYSRGILFSGFDFFQFYGRDLEIHESQNEPPVITGAYNG